MKKVNWGLVILAIVVILLGIVLLINKKAEAKMIQSVQGQPVKPRPEMSNAVDTLSQPESSGSKSGTIIKVKQTYNILKLGDTGEYVKIFQRIIGAKVDGIFGEETWNTWLDYQLTIK